MHQPLENCSFRHGPLIALLAQTHAHLPVYERHLIYRVGKPDVRRWEWIVIGRGEWKAERWNDSPEGA